MQGNMKLFVIISLITLLALLIQNKIRPALLFGGLASLYYVFGFINFNTWAGSFVNNSLITLIFLLLVSITLEKTVLIELFSKFIISKSYQRSLLKLGVITSLFSAFLNNTAVVASLMGLIKNNRFHSPSKLLIPLSYFAILGGTMTLVGTSTNLVVNSFVIENKLEPIKMFDFLYVGGFVAFFGIATIILFSFLLPEIENTQDNVTEHIIEMRIEPNSKLVGKSIKENGLRNLEYLFLIEIRRGEHILTPVSPDEILEEGDKLIFSGDIKHIEMFSRFDGLQLSSGDEITKLNLVDAIITPESTLIEQKVKEANFRSKFDAAIISLKRGAENISRIGEARLQAGDRLVLAVGKDFSKRENITKNFYILSNLETDKKLTSKESLLIVLGFLTVIFGAAVEIFQLMKGLLVLLALFLFFRFINLSELKRRFPFDIFIIVGSSLAITKVLVESGVAQDLAELTIGTFGVYGAYGSFVGVYILTALLTEIITNNAAAALAFPIAFATATALGVSPYPFIFAVAFGASASFMTPYGYQTNLMVSSLGGYGIRDFMKIGAIISIVHSLTVLVFIPIFFKF